MDNNIKTPKKILIPISRSKYLTFGESCTKFVESRHQHFSLICIAAILSLLFKAYIKQNINLSHFIATMSHFRELRDVKIELNFQSKNVYKKCCNVALMQYL